jgi:hypothetical protein
MLPCLSELDGLGGLQAAKQDAPDSGDVVHPGRQRQALHERVQDEEPLAGGSLTTNTGTGIGA